MSNYWSQVKEALEARIALWGTVAGVLFALDKMGMLG